MFASLAVRLLCECMTVCQGRGERLQDGTDRAVIHHVVCLFTDGGSAG